MISPQKRLVRSLCTDVSILTCDSSYLSLKKSPNETSDVRPKTDPDEVEGLQFASVCLLDKTVTNHSHCYFTVGTTCLLCVKLRLCFI